MPQFDVEVFNEGSFGGQKHVGRGTAPLKTLIAELNQHVSFVLPLSYFGKEGKNATGTSKGQIVVRGFIEGPPKVAKTAPPIVTPEQPSAAAPAPVKAPAPAVADNTKSAAATAPEPAAKPAATTAPAVVAEPPAQATAAAPTAAPATAVAKKEPASAAPVPLAPSADFDDTKPLKLRLTRLGLRDLKDTGGMFDKQDPALRITVGDNKPFETHRYSKPKDFVSTFFLSLSFLK